MCLSGDVEGRHRICRGRPQKKNNPWVSEESWGLADQREEMNKKVLGTRSERVKRQLEVKCAEKDREVKRLRGYDGASIHTAENR